jgi:hypothetical protein
MAYKEFQKNKLKKKIKKKGLKQGKIPGIPCWFEKITE